MKKLAKTFGDLKKKLYLCTRLLRTKLFNKERMVLEAQYGGRSSVG